MQSTACMWAHSAPCEPGSDLDRAHAVIRFKRALDFPRFSVRAGEFWSFVVYRKWEVALRQIKAGERFAFAGGQCLAEDIELVYEGECGLAYERVAVALLDEISKQPRTGVPEWVLRYVLERNRCSQGQFQALVAGLVEHGYMTRKANHAGDYCLHPSIKGEGLRRALLARPLPS